jgi:hypothetical protein
LALRLAIATKDDEEDGDQYQNDPYHRGHAAGLVSRVAGLCDFWHLIHSSIIEARYYFSLFTIFSDVSIET